MALTKRKVEHPAMWSSEILVELAKAIPAGGRPNGRWTPTHVHDPFAGTGERLGNVADANGWRFTGTEIEAAFIIDERVQVGDATLRSSYPRRPFVIVTSPVYPNGIADDFNAQDGSTRRTYRAALSKVKGKDTRLQPNNMGAYGYRGQPFHSINRAMYWRLASDAIACWSRADAVYLNVSDFMQGGNREPVVSQWIATMQIAGWTLAARPKQIKTRRYKMGRNSSARVETEYLLHFVPLDAA